MFSSSFQSLRNAYICFSSAVFGSYLRPDLVPANPSFYEGSSMGTISTSSIFVNVEDQTEERYSSSLLSFFYSFACSVKRWVDLGVEMCPLSPWNSDAVLLYMTCLQNEKEVM